MKRKISSNSYFVVDVTPDEKKTTSQFTYFEFVLVVLVITCALEARLDVIKQWIGSDEYEYYEDWTARIVTFTVIAAACGAFGHWLSKFRKSDLIRIAAAAVLLVHICGCIILNVFIFLSLFSNIPHMVPTLVNIGAVCITAFNIGINIGATDLKTI
uniref:Uncharacterized protein n=1 Tax=Ciona savignyi TaxID=51511 RepID=H2ZM44_CIOSA